MAPCSVEKQSLLEKPQLCRFDNKPTLTGSSAFVLLTPINAERHNLTRKLILNIYYNFSNEKISAKIKKVCHQETHNHIVNKLTKSKCISPAPLPSGPCRPRSRPEKTLWASPPRSSLAGRLPASSCTSQGDPGRRLDDCALRPLASPRPP